MISWIQNYIIRKGRVVALALLAMVIFAFVFTIGNTPGCTTDSSGYQEQLYYGIDLNAPNEREELARKVSLSANLNGQQMRSEEQFQAALMGRVALLALADRIGIPDPTPVTLADFIRTKNAFRGADGEFSQDAYTRFVDSIESNPRIPSGLLVLVLNEDFRIDQVQTALAGPGYMLPSEAIAQAKSDQTEYELEIATLSFADFSPELNPSEEDLTDYFEETKQRYEIAERIKASYVSFSAENYASRVSAPTDAELRQHFAQNRATFVEAYEALNSAAEEETESEPTPVTFDLVKGAVSSDLINTRASRLANEAAQAFAYQLYIEGIDQGSELFDQLLADQHVELSEIEPYTLAEAGQRGLSLDMLRSAFELSGNRYYSDAYEIDGGFGVLIYSGRIAPEIPPYADVALRVRGDYVAEEKRRLFNEKGENLKTELETALANGGSFQETSESLDLEFESFDAFTPRTAPRELNRSVFGQAQQLENGELSSMLNLGGIGTFVYLKNKQVPEIDTDSDEIAQSKQMLQNWAAFTSQRDLINHLIVQGLPDAPEHE